jgi:hypothetical protein
MRLALTLAVLALALAQSPTGAAHLGNLPQGTVVTAGPYSVAFSPTPENPFVNDTVGLTAQVADLATGLRARDAAVDVNVLGPGHFNETRHLNDDGTGYLVASIRAPAAGVYTLRADVKNTSTQEVYPVSATIQVFPDLGFRIRSVDPNIDITAGRTVPLAIESVDPVSLQRKARFDDLTVSIEHWTNDHKTMLASEDVAATKASPGLFRLDHVFPEQGMYHLRFASQGGGFKPDDVPLLHAIANPPAASAAKTPFPALLAVAALALAGAAMRRR